MRWLLDEMMPPEACGHLRNLGHDAVSVLQVGLGTTADSQILAWAIEEQRILVTENFNDFSALLGERISDGRPCIPAAFVHRDKLPGGGALPFHLARLLDTWAKANPEPHVGPHWL